MKKLLSLAMSLLLLASAVFVVPTTVSAAKKSLAETLKETWYTVQFACVAKDHEFTEKDGPSADFVHTFISATDEFSDEYGLGYDTGKYRCKVTAKKYEAAVFKYFKKSDRLLKELRKSEEYSDGKYEYTLLGGMGGFSTITDYAGYKKLSNNRYEVYAYTGWLGDFDAEKLYTPSKKDKLGKDYLNMFSAWSGELFKSYIRLDGGEKVVVSYDGKSAPKILSRQKFGKNKIIKALGESSPKVKSINLSSTEYTYNGKAKKPTVKIVNTYGEQLIENEDYVVVYPKGRKAVGTYKIKVYLNGVYSATKTLSFKINPPKTKLGKITPSKDKLAVKISKKKNQTDGYQLQGSSSKKFKDARTITLKGYKSTTYTFKGLKSQKTYYVRVRTYKTVNGKRYYSAWSSPKAKKTK